MEITQQIRDYAKKPDFDAVNKQRMWDMPEAWKKKSGELYGYPSA